MQYVCDDTYIKLTPLLVFHRFSDLTAGFLELYIRSYRNTEKTYIKMDEYL